MNRFIIALAIFFAAGIASAACPAWDLNCEAGSGCPKWDLNCK